MALTKLVNGQRVPLSSAEEVETRAEWDAWVPPTLPTLRDRIISRLRADPAARAQAIETRDRLGLTTPQMLNLLVQKADETL